MDHFLYKKGALYAEDVDIAQIAAQVGTPFYLYSSATLLRHFHLFEQALSGLEHTICFAVKAASNQAILTLLAKAGAGMDVVSGGEYQRAIAAGVAGEKIVFSGVGKTAEEMALAIKGGIRQFNVESEPELQLLSCVAVSHNTQVPITIRINPDVDAQTHEKISTGRKGDKFGIPMAHAREVYAQAARLPGLKVVGIDVHIGSQLTALEPFEQAYGRVAELTKQLRQDGHTIRRLDLGGGLGIPYHSSNIAPPLPLEYGAMVRRVLGHLECEIEVEPGRLIVGNGGVMVSRVLYVKKGYERCFLILDSAMNDLLRPAMYDAHHDILPLIEPPAGVEYAPYDVVGPVCESADTFAKARPLPPLQAGDLVAFRSAGAYGAVMSSEYNTRPLIPEVMVQADRYAVIRPRPSLDEIIARDHVPKWI